MPQYGQHEERSRTALTTPPNGSARRKRWLAQARGPPSWVNPNKAKVILHKKSPCNSLLSHSLKHMNCHANVKLNTDSRFYFLGTLIRQKLKISLNWKKDAFYLSNSGGFRPEKHDTYVSEQPEIILTTLFAGCYLANKSKALTKNYYN